MNKWIKTTVLRFMEENETWSMNTNQFVLNIYSQYFWKVFEYAEWPSFEWITRARRFITKTHWIGERTNATKEMEYIKQFSLNNKI